MATYWISYDNTEDKRRRRETRRRWRWPCPGNGSGEPGQQNELLGGGPVQRDAAACGRCCSCRSYSCSSAG